MAGFEANKTPLLANATYTSATLMSETYDTIVGSVESDKAGTLYIEQSQDGTNWDVSTSYSITAGNGKGFTEIVVAPYFRVKYTNGGANQTNFRIYVKRSAAGTR